VLSLGWTPVRPLPVAALDIADSDVRDLYGCHLAPIRPDQHVAWRDNAEPNDAAQLLAQVTGG
jgi:hypothetical protein